MREISCPYFKTRKLKPESILSKWELHCEKMSLRLVSIATGLEARTT